MSQNVNGTFERENGLTDYFFGDELKSAVSAPSISQKYNTTVTEVRGEPLLRD